MYPSQGKATAAAVIEREEAPAQRPLPPPRLSTRSRTARQMADRPERSALKEAIIRWLDEQL